MANSTHSNLEGSISLRKLIEHKRKSGQMQAALTLAKLGRRIFIQTAQPIATDEISRSAFELYLEISPDDLEVEAALDILGSAPSRDVAPKKKIPLVAILISLFIISSISVAAIFKSKDFFAKEKSLSKAPAPATTIPKPIIAQTVPKSSLAASSAAVPQTPIVIRAVGDVVLGSNYPKLRLPDEATKKRITALHQTLNNADVVVGNLEGVLYDKGQATKDVTRAGYFTFRMPENYASTLREMGFDVLSMANNHSMDFGAEGMEATKNSLLAEGIQPVGVPGAEIAIVSVRETKIAFLSYSYLTTVSPMNNDEQITLDIQHAKELASFVIVTVHAGGEGEAAAGAPESDEYFMNEYRGNIRKFSMLAIDSGASAVFGHGPHLVRPYEIYKEKPIFFSLGNFVGFRTLSTKGTLGNSIVAEVRFSPQGQLLGAGIIPLKMDEWGIPTADYSVTTLNALDDLLDKQLEKRPVLELKSTANIQPKENENLSSIKSSSLLVNSDRSESASAELQKK